MKGKLYFVIATVSIIVCGLSVSEIRAQDYWENPDSTISIVLPVVPRAWESYQPARADTIVIPNYRPIYALIVSGYASNKNLDEIMLYNLTRHLLGEGAYVHHSWWNNLLAPYQERPLHWDQSEPGSLTSGSNIGGFIPFPKPDGTLEEKAVPEDDYQLQADAERFLRAVRAFNPDAIVIVAGHSMGGGAVARLGSETNQIIDILAPIDPVGNRSLPFAVPWLIDPLTPFDSINQINPLFPWTRWRGAHENFLGWRQYDCDDRYKWTSLCKVKSNCVLVGPWRQFKPLLGSVLSLKCLAEHPEPYAHKPARRRFESNIINLYHRFQQEAIFPFDFKRTELFIHNTIGCASSTQLPVELKGAGASDPGGWEDVGWDGDGHGEIIGYRGPVVDLSREENPRPLGIKIRTSVYCDWDGFEGADSWPVRYLDNDIWVNGDGLNRKNILMEFERFCQTYPDSLWENSPTRPDLCLVSGGLIALYEKIIQGYGPSITLDLYPNSIWPPNHEMIEIQATVEAVSGCGDIETMELVSIVSSEEDDWLGDGHTAGDIADADFSTFDNSFKLRSERMGNGGGRIYTVTYRATDVMGNQVEASAEVVVENLPPGDPKGFTVHYDTGKGNRLFWQEARDPDFSNFAIYRSTDPDFIPDRRFLVDETIATSWIDPEYDNGNVYYKITAVDQTGLESVAASENRATTDHIEFRQTEPVVFTVLPFINQGQNGEATRLILMGNDDVDVLDIYPYSLSISGLKPIGWKYADAAATLGNIETDCDCPIEGLEGHRVLLLDFDKSALANMLAKQPTIDQSDLSAEVISRTEAAEQSDPHISLTEIEVSIAGELKDGTPLNGQAYILIKDSDKTELQLSGGDDLPRQFALDTNYPNPFNPGTTISFTLPEGSRVRLEVFNILGQQVDLLIDEHLEAGVHSTVWDGSRVSSGFYLYRLQAGEFTATRKMLLLK